MVRSLKSSSRRGIITEIIEIVGTNASKKVEALIDTGAEGNHISERSSKELESIGLSGLRETVEVLQIMGLSIDMRADKLK